MHEVQRQFEEEKQKIEHQFKESILQMKQAEEKKVEELKIQ